MQLLILIIRIEYDQPKRLSQSSLKVVMRQIQIPFSQRPPALPMLRQFAAQAECSAIPLNERRSQVTLLCLSARSVSLRIVSRGISSLGSSWIIEVGAAIRATTPTSRNVKKILNFILSLTNQIIVAQLRLLHWTFDSLTIFIYKWGCLYWIKIVNIRV